MILVDTSVWVDHLRQGEPHLAQLLEEGFVVTHPMILGELALGNASPEVLSNLRNLSALPEASHEEVLQFIALHRLAGTGIGLVDAHLLAACFLTPRTLLWTRDRALERVARRLSVAYEP